MMSGTYSMAGSIILKDEIPERSLNNRVYKFCYIICMNWAFTTFITLLIMANTAALALESYPVNKDR